MKAKDELLFIDRLNKDADNIEEKFFEMDEDEKITKINLQFKSPKDIFDSNIISKKPILNDSFNEWFSYCLKLAPTKYQLELHIYFDDLSGYSEEELKQIFVDNIILDRKIYDSSKKVKNNVAIGLIILGIILLIGNIIFTAVLPDDLTKTIFTYILDIAATVTFWEALGILLVERNVHRTETIATLKKIKSINFHKKEKDD